MSSPRRRRAGELAPIGQVRFRFAGKGLWAALDTIRARAAERGYVPVRPLLVATVNFFGRCKTSNDGVLIGMPRLR